MKIYFDFNATLEYEGPDLDEDGIHDHFHAEMFRMRLEDYALNGYDIVGAGEPDLLDKAETYELARLMGGKVMETLCGYDEIHGLGVREIAILKDRSEMIITTSYYPENDTYLVIVRESE